MFSHDCVAFKEHISKYICLFWPIILIEKFRKLKFWQCCTCVMLLRIDIEYWTGLFWLVLELYVYVSGPPDERRNMVQQCTKLYDAELWLGFGLPVDGCGAVNVVTTSEPSLSTNWSNHARSCLKYDKYKTSLPPAPFYTWDILISISTPLKILINS